MNRRLNGAIVGLLPWIVPLVCVIGCSTNSEKPSYVNSFDPTLGQGLPVPDSVRMAVGDNTILITWGLPEGTSADEYAVFRRTVGATGADQSERLEGRVATPKYTDTRVRNGLTYVYRIAAGAHGQFGTRTDEIQATPALLAILLADGAQFTSSRSISVGLTAPSPEAVRFTEDADSFPTAWLPASSPVTWMISAGDGAKTVYAEFRFADGSISLPVSSTIRLDTKAVIQSISFDGSRIRKPGDTIHFSLVAGETNGSATISIDGVFSGEPLYDDGTNGDRTARDGTYESDLLVPPAASAVNRQVTGEFTDEAGNVATSAVAPQLISIQQGPEAVNLIPPSVAEPPDLPAVTLRWSQSTAGNFSSYRLFRAETAQVDSTGKLIDTLADATILQRVDAGVIEGRTYSYRLYVVNSSGLETGSNTVRVLVPNVRPPGSVTLQTPNSVSATRIGLEWSKSQDLDFQAYRVFRNKTGDVGDNDQLLTEITDINHVFWDDSGLEDNTTYYYRVVTVDNAGLESRSNEIHVKTKSNDSPDAVTLAVPTVSEPPDAPSVTLRWTQSLDQTFSAYRIYRAESAPVDSTGRLLDTEASAITLVYDDTSVVEGRTYYYRVYVANSLGNETGSNAVQVLVPNVRPPSPVTLEVPTSASTDRVGLVWSRSGELDFRLYRVFRNESGVVDDSDLVVATLTDIERTYWDDTGLQENTKYYYRVYTDDQGGLTGRSNEVTVTTKNLPPPPVALNEPSAIDSTAATLSWAQSDVHDFAHYRLYRDSLPTVTTSSHLVVDMDDKTFTAFRDTGLIKGTRYYYRVFVVDSGDTPEAVGSNTITFITL